jgi:hypothetical protein
MRTILALASAFPTRTRTKVNAARCGAAALGASIPNQLSCATGQGRIDKTTNSTARSIEDFRTNGGAIARYIESHRRKRCCSDWAEIRRASAAVLATTGASTGDAIACFQSPPYATPARRVDFLGIPMHDLADRRRKTARIKKWMRRDDGRPDAACTLNRGE